MEIGKSKSAGPRWLHAGGLAVAMALAASGCATLSPEQCVGMDWYALGQQDALGGHDPDRITRHGEACAKGGIVPDGTAWRAGYQDALPAFCVGGQGYLLGARGGSYYRQCPPELEAGFLDGFHLGEELAELRRQESEIDREIDRLRDAMDDEDATDASREADGRWLDHAKRERDRLQERRWRIDARARERGYPPTW